MSVAVVTDSTADLPPALLERWQVNSLPLTVQFGDQSYRDGLDIDLPEIIRRIQAGEKIPGTSQVPPGVFAQTYAALLEQHEAVISLHISGGLSGTVDSARLAAREFGGRVTVFDTRTATLPQGLLVLRAAQAAAEGQSAEQIAALLERLIPLSGLRFSLESLDYLRQNGRIGGAAGLLGSVLNIRPVLTVQAGKVEAAAKVRGTRRALESMVSYLRIVTEQHGETELAYVLTPGGEDTLALLRAEVAALNLPVRDLGEFMVGGVIGAHVGPGGFGLATLPLR